MVSNEKDFKEMISESLKKIRNDKGDIFVMQKQNENLCKNNDVVISRLNDQIVKEEYLLKTNFVSSKEDKVETKYGYVSYKTQPDKVVYDEPVIIESVKARYPDKIDYFLKTIITIKKDAIKSQYLGNDDYPDGIEGVSVIPQEKKFIYKIKDLI